jgi:pyruvate dehydrogenase E2 component (dihydrolipoamide acetyltransferase)
MPERVFLLPDLGEGLEEAVVSAWLVAEGDAVELNQPFVEIETAKATVEVPAPFAGTISKLHVGAGETLAVGAPLATFEVAGSVGPLPVTATPAVRKLGKDLGVDLSDVAGSGPDGRITRADVERLADSGRETEDVGRSTAASKVPLSPTRRAIAARLTEVAAIPQVTTFRTIECSALETLCEGLRVSPLPVFVKALAEVCREHPKLNSSWDGERILLFPEIRVGIATDTERGLMVPVLAEVGSLGITEIAAEIARLAEAARSNMLSRDDGIGATIAVTNTGSYGSEFGTPLLNPGHAVTIALGVIEPRALVVEGVVEARPACTLSLTFDHRVLDGAIVGRALGALVELLESRERLEALPR